MFAVEEDEKNAENRYTRRQGENVEGARIPGKFGVVVSGQRKWEAMLSHGRRAEDSDSKKMGGEKKRTERE